MKKIYFLLTVLATIFSTSGKAQVGYIYTFANYSACNIALDNSGKLYTASGTRVYKIDTGGVTTTIVGGGVSYGDGGAATAARLSNATNLAFDKAGNMYIADKGYGVIRKVNTAGVISTVAGDYTLGTGYTGDGGMATAAKLSCADICVDGFGNLYIADDSHYVIRKVNTSGIISTVAGNGSPGFSGDGGLATLAKLDNYSEESIWGMTTDLSGNLYISSGSDFRIRKVDGAGIITTVAGNGSSGHSGVGGPATAATIYYPQGLTMDAGGNLFIAEWQNCVLEVVNTAGILNTVSGNYTISFGGDGGPATAAGMNAVSDVAIDPWGNVYIADCHNSRIRKVTGVAIGGGITSPTDSFSVALTGLCNGPNVTIVTPGYTSGMYVKTDFGDATTDSSVILKGYTIGGYAQINHTYNSAGSYSISQVLYKGGLPIDTIVTPYNYTFCRTLPVKIFYDDNVNGVMDGAEKYMSLPSVTRVDSNGITVGKISATGGFNYCAYAPIGTKYSFTPVTLPGDIVVSSPGTATLADTVDVSTTYNDKYFGLSCPTKTSFDLSVHAVVPVTGVNDQWGNIYLANTACYTSGATLTFYFSPKWDFDVSSARPAAASVSGNSATWNIPAISNNDPKPIDIYYVLWAKSGGPKLKPRDTVYSYYSITPASGDKDPTNNIIVRNDTVRAGCDPNAIEVSPAGCIPSDIIQLQYTIHFENTGNDTAHNIYVMDTLPAEVDPASLRLVMASANMNISMLKDGGRNIARFDFPLINLLDSSHHGECDGTVIYNIDLRKGLPDGTNIANHAGIFFDYNDVVMTNTITTLIGCPALHTSGNAGTEVLVYPNPATDELTIQTENDTYASCTITNSIGQVLMQQPIAAAKTTMNVKQLPAGLYYVTLKGDNGSKVQKFVKL